MAPTPLSTGCVSLAGHSESWAAVTSSWSGETLSTQPEEGQEAPACFVEGLLNPVKPQGSDTMVTRLDTIR